MRRASADAKKAAQDAIAAKRAENDDAKRDADAELAAKRKAQHRRMVVEDRAAYPKA